MWNNLAVATTLKNAKTAKSAIKFGFHGKFGVFPLQLKIWKNELSISSESVSEGHPDKVADQISDALVDQFLAYDDQAHCAIESFVTTGQVVIMGRGALGCVYRPSDHRHAAPSTASATTRATISSTALPCGILTAIHEQSDDINRGVSREQEGGTGCRRPGEYVRLRHQRDGELYACVARPSTTHHACACRHTSRRQGNDLSAPLTRRAR